MNPCRESLSLSTHDSLLFKGQEQIRAVLSSGIGKVLTPEIAASIEAACRKSAEPLDSKIQRLTGDLMQQPQVPCPVRHYFAPGLFAREITIGKGVNVVGAVHREDSIIIVSMGCILVATEDDPIKVSAGETLICKAGMRNAVFTLEDTRWTNFYPNPDNETDIEKLAERFTESKLSELLGGSDNPQLMANAELQKLKD